VVKVFGNPVAMAGTELARQMAALKQASKAVTACEWGRALHPSVAVQVD
jgi:hypothetical protein